MNKAGDNFNKPSSERLIKEKEKSITPAILGIPSVSHGAKISLSMNDKDKNDLLLKLEEWRQKRRDNLTKRVLKANPVANLSLPVKPKIKTKIIPSSTGSDVKPKCSPKKNVFDRLSEKPLPKKIEETKIKKVEEKTSKLIGNKKLQNLKPLKTSSVEEKKNPQIILNKPENMSELIISEACVETQISISTVEEDEKKLMSELVNDPEKLEPVTVKEAGISEDLPKVEETEEPKCNMNSVKVEELESKNETDENECEVKNDMKKNIKQIKSFRIPSKGIMIRPNQKKPLRRSISLIFRQKKGNYQTAIHRTQSENNIKNVCSDTEEESVEVSKHLDVITDEVEKDTTDTIIINNVKEPICTPKPKSINCADLRNKLEDWLSKKGQSIEEYKHLQCFGLNMDKTPIHRVQKMDDSFNVSLYSTAPNTPVADAYDESDKENVTPPVMSAKVDANDIEDYLTELHHLIVHVKYPTDRCEEWLNAISKKFPNCKKLPVFWECEAAIYGDPNKLNNDSDTKKGTENSDNTLAQMLDKLVIDEKCHSASKTERGLSMDNIFKSKTVKFALKEMKVSDPTEGKEEKVLVATPVRRSARIQTPYKSGNVVNSLKSLDPETRRKVSFQPNDALFTG